MQDPFAGVERLNQLTPEELKSRNDRMSNQVQSRSYSKDKTQEQLDEESRQYYRNLNQARYLPQSTTTTVSSSSDPVRSPSPLQSQQIPQQPANGLPLGWNERMNQTNSISDLTPSLSDLDRAELEHQLTTIDKGIVALRELVDKHMDVYMALSEADDADEDQIVAARTQLKTTRAQLATAVAKAAELRKSLE